METTQVSLSEIDCGGSSDQERTQIVLSWGESEFHMTLASVHRSMGHITSLSDLSKASDTIRDKGSPAYFNTDGAQVVHVFGTDFPGIIDDLQSTLDDPETNCESLVIDGLRKLGRNHLEIRRRLIQIRDVLAPHGIQIGVVEMDPSGSEIHGVDPASEEFDWVLRTLTLADQASLARQREATKDDVRKWAGLEYNGGRPGLGFEAVDGELVPGPRYGEVCSCLELVAEGEMSKRQAAAHLNTSDRTITRCIEDRPKRYGLQI